MAGADVVIRVGSNHAAATPIGLKGVSAIVEQRYGGVLDDSLSTRMTTSATRGAS